MLHQTTRKTSLTKRNSRRRLIFCEPLEARTLLACVAPCLPGEIVEAEDGTVAGLFQIENDATASNGQFVSTPAGNGAAGPGSDYAEYTFLVTSAGNYLLEAVVDGPNGGADSFFVTVDDQPVDGYLWDIPSGWISDPLADRGGADPVVLTLAPGEHAVRFHLREGGARLDTLTLVDLNNNSEPALPGEIVEAEAGTLTGSFAIQLDATASGGQYVATPSGSFASGPATDFAEYQFSIPTDSQFLLEAVVDGPNGGSDSFYVTVDDQPVDGYLWDIPAGWVTDELSERGGADPVTFSLTAGEHTVRVHLREGGARLDTLMLVDLTPAAPPTPALPGEVVEAEAGTLAGSFSAQNDPTASGGQYVAAPGSSGASGPGADFVEFAFFVPNAGDYFLEAVVDGLDGGSDSFFVTVDDLPAGGYLWDIPAGWTADQLSDRGGDDRVVLGLSPGAHTVRVHLREGGARLDTIALNPTELIRSQGAGLIGEYFDAVDLTDPVLVRTDATIDFDWGNGAPDPAVGVETFSVRWTGQIEPLYSETYTFETVTDDGVRLWIDDQLIIDQWVNQLPTTHSGTATLVAGQLTSIRMECFEDFGGAVAQLAWQSASQPLEVVPSAQLYEPPGVVSLDTNLVSADEDAGTADVVLRRKLGSEGAVTVDFQTFAGTATETADFTPQMGTALFLPGQTQISVAVPIENDALQESVEDFTFTIDNVFGGADLLAPRTATIFIIDDDTILPDFADFSDPTSLTLNGDAGTSGNALQLTPESNNQVGSAYFNEPFVITSETSFQTEFQFQLTGGPNGAEGFVFVIQDSPAGLAALGTGGDGKGYGGVMQSLAVEFDTSDGGGELNDNHISVLASGDVAAPLESRSAQFDLNDSNVAFVWVDYNGPTDQLAVYLSFTDTKPALPRLTASADLAALVGSQAYLGFAAATSGANNAHNILSWEFRESPPSMIPFPDPAAEPDAETIASGLVQPTAIDWSDNGQNMLIAEKSGIVKVMRNGSVLAQPFVNISDQVNGVRDRGLLDIAAHPNFVLFPYVYLLFTYDPPEVFSHSGLAGPDGKGNRAGRLIRVTADAQTNYTTAVAGSEVILLGENSTWDNFNAFANSTNDFNEPPAGILPDGTNIQDFIASDSESHTIGSVDFGPDQSLYVSIGDGTSYNNVDPRTVRVQDIDNLSGKILRVDPITGDGLADNPFYNGDADANRSKVYQYGLRNPFRMAVDPISGKPYIGDVGWTAWEEVNAADAGANFGWPYYEGGSGNSLQTPGYQTLPEAQAFYASGEEVTASIFALNHAASGINAIVMGDVYTGAVYPSDYQGDVFFNDLGQGIVSNLSLDAQGNVIGVETFATGANVVVQITQGPDDHLYFVDLDDGRVGRWVFPSSVSVAASPTFVGPASHLVSGSTGGGPALTDAVFSTSASRLESSALAFAEGGGSVALVDQLPGCQPRGCSLRADYRAAVVHQRREPGRSPSSSLDTWTDRLTDLVQQTASAVVESKLQSA